MHSKADGVFGHNIEKVLNYVIITKCYNNYPIQLLPVLLGELAEASGAEQIKQKGQTLVDHVSEWQKLQNKRVSSMSQPKMQQVMLLYFTWLLGYTMLILLLHLDRAGG